MTWNACIYNISHWYYMIKLCINKKKSNVYITGRKSQLWSMNLDDFDISIDADQLSLAKRTNH